MKWEGVARLFVGIGFLWMAIVLIVGFFGGLDTPSTWVRLLGEVWRPELTRNVYLVLAYVVVPIGMLTFLRDILTDPVSLWVKAAAPGAFVAIYATFLLAAMPDVGQPLFARLAVLAPVVPPGSLSTSLEATGSWLVRAVAAVAVLGGIPAVVVGLLGAIGLFGRDTRRR